ncbi:MAG: hypothetical protein WCR52_13305 [Bacteroidota bacterium]
MNPQPTSDFEQFCQSYSVWILQYNSDTLKNPVFLIWYDDMYEDNINKLLTFRSGQVFSTTDLPNIKSHLDAHISDLLTMGKIDPWINKLDQFQPTADVTYDIDVLCNAIKSKQLNASTLNDLTNFINLFDDLLCQDPQYKHLNTYRENEYVQAAWQYYYDYIFWPKFNDPEKDKTWKRPALKIDHLKLLEGVLAMKAEFEKSL